MKSNKSWELVYSVSLTLFALAYVAIYSFEVLSDASGSLRTNLELASNMIWILFCLDYLTRFFLAKRKIDFISENFIELASLVLPFIRALRMLRILTAFSQLNQFAKSAQARVNVLLLGAMPMIFFMSALGILDVERHAADSKIHSFADSLWWCLSTIATVGYGDLYPVTNSGRLIAAVLLFTGIGFMSLITANIATWFMKSIANNNSSQMEEPK